MHDGRADGRARRPLVLVADDDASIRRLVHDCLVPEGFLCLACADGLQLLRALELVRPALILLDVRMPRLDGHGVLERLRADPLLRLVPVVAMSAQAEGQPLLEAGSRAFLPKPFDLDALVGAVRAALVPADAGSADAAAAGQDG